MSTPATETLDPPTIDPAPTTTSVPPGPGRRPPWLIPAGIGLIVAIGAGFAAARFPAGSPSATADDPAKDRKKDGPKHDLKTTVVLPDGKLKAAKIGLGAARSEDLATEVGVPGSITINADRRVEIKPRVPGVVRSVAATLGRKVKAGETLVVLDSPDIGTARLNLRARQRELATARVEGDWKRQVAVNVEELVPLLRKGTPARQLEEGFRDKLLGSFRGDLLGTYAEYEIASHEEEKQALLGQQGLVGEHPVFLSKHTREGKQARFEATLEQVRFDAKQQKLVADQQLQAAEAAVIDAAQRLRMLGVSEDLARVLARDAASAVATAGEYEDVTSYPIVAPFDGTIVARTAVPSQRVELTDGLFTLADLTTVRATASVPESSLQFLPRMGVPTVRLTATGVPGRTFDAKVIYTGEEVDPATRTVALLAELPNPEGLLRPGMFARILLDSNTKTRALTVPAGALMEVDGKAGVFRPGDNPNTFVFHPVAAGLESGGRRVITSGLAEGDTIVVDGAFLLKSELVLQNETEEE